MTEPAGETAASPLLPQWGLAAAIAALVILAYFPALNNGFISDDFVILERIQTWKHQPLYLFSIPPEQFRTTTYACFALLETLAGRNAEFFYAFTILLHFWNCLLLHAWVARATGSGAIAAATAIAFAVCQNPQEAVMWLAGMNEALLGMFALLALVAWQGGRPAWAAAACCGALLSKESGIIVPALILLLDNPGERPLGLRKEHAWLLAPGIAFAVLFFGTLRHNALAGSGLFAFRAGAAKTALFTLSGLCYPWVLLAIVTRWSQRLPALTPGWIRPAGWAVTALLPYIWITYQSRLPSRHLYIAMMGIAWLLAHLLSGELRATVRWSFLAVLVAVNVGYLWVVKDRQFEERAAPTRELMRVLSGMAPQPVCVRLFPLNPWIARDTALHLPGWSIELIQVDAAGEPCGGQKELVWDGRERRYH